MKPTYVLTWNDIVELAAQTFPGRPDEREDALAQMRRWVRRSDGVAVYRNEALDSSQAGTYRFCSFGSDQAQLETDDPPERLPDFQGIGPGWAFVLYGTYRPQAAPSR